MKVIRGKKHRRPIPWPPVASFEYASSAFDCLLLDTWLKLLRQDLRMSLLSVSYRFEVLFT